MTKAPFFFDTSVSRDILKGQLSITAIRCTAPMTLAGENLISGYNKFSTPIDVSATEINSLSQDIKLWGEIEEGN